MVKWRKEVYLWSLQVRKPNPAGKFAKWICELQEFSFTFITESTTRASLADLLTGKEEEEETNVKEELQVRRKNHFYYRKYH